MNRSGLYYEKKPVTENDVVLMNEIHDIYSEWSFYGYRKIHAVLKIRGYKANRKKVQRLMQLIGLRAVWPGKKTTVRDYKQAIYPYLLKDLVIDRAKPGMASRYNIHKNQGRVCVFSLFNRCIQQKDNGLEYLSIL